MAVGIKPIIETLARQKNDDGVDVQYSSRSAVAKCHKRSSSIGAPTSNLICSLTVAVWNLKYYRFTGKLPGQIAYFEVTG